MTTSGPGGDTPTANLAGKTQRGDESSTGEKRAAVMSCRMGKQSESYVFKMVPP